MTRFHVEQGEAADTIKTLGAQVTKKNQKSKATSPDTIQQQEGTTFLLLVNVIKSGPFNVQNSRYIIYHSLISRRCGELRRVTMAVSGICLSRQDE